MATIRCGISCRLSDRHRAVDLFGKVRGQPVHQLLGGLRADRVRVYNTCAGYRYVRGIDHENRGSHVAAIKDLPESSRFALHPGCFRRDRFLTRTLC